MLLTLLLLLLLTLLMLLLTLLMLLLTLLLLKLNNLRLLTKREPLGSLLYCLNISYNISSSPTRNTVIPAVRTSALTFLAA
ncbi:hypothetical protein AB2762_12195 [Acinetobacter indicus]